MNNPAYMMASMWQQFASVLFSDDVLLFAALALAIVLAFHIVAVLWDVTRGEDDATP